jgi:hypothetical protein
MKHILSREELDDYLVPTEAENLYSSGVHPLEESGELFVNLPKGERVQT